MKRFLLFVLLAVLGTGTANAYDFSTNWDREETKEVVADGVVPGMMYRQIKDLYDYKEYVTEGSDRYSPGWSGVASFFIPGLGQVVCGEVGRGLAWWGGSVACSTATIVLSLVTAYSSYGDFLFFAAASGVVAIKVCSIVDGVRVAKVKNMYNQDLKKVYALDVDLYPSVNYISTTSGIKPTAGLTLALKF